MINLQANFEKALQKLQRIFKNSFYSAHIIDVDALPIVNCISDGIKIDPDEICAKACSLFSELDNVNDKLVGNTYDSSLIKNRDFIYLLSQIPADLRLLIILRNNENDFTLNNVNKIAKELGGMVDSIILDENAISDIFSDFDFLPKNNLHVLNSEDILIRKIIIELKSILTPSSYKTRFIKEFQTNSININSNNENLRFILRMMKLLKNNYNFHLR
jgi:predicted regulator of Ras-like GTPase activity (Roadblock/LC7/MglB family)